MDVFYMIHLKNADENECILYNKLKNGTENSRFDFKKNKLVRDAPLDFKGGGSRKFGSGQVFFSLQPGKEIFFIFST